MDDFAETAPFLSRVGEITWVTGCMYAGKTQELIRLLTRYSYSHKSIKAVKHASDGLRFDDTFLGTHDKHRFPCISTSKLMDVYETVKDADVIGIDEAQCFEDLKDFCLKITVLGKDIILASLNGTYQAQNIGYITDIIPLVSHIKHLTAICYFCKNDRAVFSAKINDDGIVIDVGGTEKYIATCPTCFYHWAEKNYTVNPMIPQDSS